MENHKRIIALRLPNWVGDVMMALPGLLFLRELGFEVHVLGKKWVGDLLDEKVFHLHFLEKKTLKNIRLIRKIPSKKMILLTNSLSSAFCARMAGKKTAGFSADFRRVFLDLAFGKQPGLHEVEYFWSLIREAGRVWWPDDNFPQEIPGNFELPLRDEIIQQAKKILADQKVNSPFIMICPSATGKTNQGESKVWPHWAAFIQKLVSENKVLIACPGPGEEASFKKDYPEMILLENIKLNVYAALMQQADLIIANDSGPMHLAAAVNPNVLGIFGVTDPIRTRPLRGRVLGKLGQWPTEESLYQSMTSINTTTMLEHWV